MKILYLTLESYLSQPIIQSQVINLFKSISHNKNDQSFHATLITFDNIETQTKKFEHYGINGFSHTMFKNRGILRNLLYIILHLDIILKGISIIHVRSYLPMIPALIAKMLFRKKVIFDVRGLLPEETLLRKNSAIQYKILYVLERIACRYADKIVVVSSSFKEIILGRSHVPAEKIAIIPTFSINKTDSRGSLEIPDFRTDIFKSHDITIFVYSGAYEKWQCAEQVIQFFETARVKLRNARFVILSRNSEEFTTLMRNTFPEDLYYVKNVNNDDLTYYLRQCNYGLLFRERNLINIVAAPIKFKDYLSAGLPVVITEGIGDYPKYVREYDLGYVLNSLDKFDFENLLDEISNSSKIFDKKKIEQMAGKLFDVGTAARNYVALYNALM